jgi:hypothetical protein
LNVICGLVEIGGLVVTLLVLIVLLLLAGQTRVDGPVGVAAEVAFFV